MMAELARSSARGAAPARNAQGRPFATLPPGLTAHGNRHDGAHIGAGRSAVVASARGPDDPGVARFRPALAASGIPPEAANARLGAALGQVLAGIRDRSDIGRFVIAGGDTSGQTLRQMGVRALTALAPTVPGAALLHAHDGRGGFDLALKGGQMGSADYFDWIRAGGGLRT